MKTKITTEISVEVMQDEIIYARMKVKEQIKNFIKKNSIDGIVYLTLDDFNEFIKGI